MRPHLSCGRQRARSTARRQRHFVGDNPRTSSTIASAPAFFRDLLILRIVHEPARRALVGKRHQDQLLPLPAPFEHAGPFIGGKQTPVESPEHLEEARLTALIGLSLSDGELSDDIDGHVGSSRKPLSRCGEREGPAARRRD
jgi:hypothetical protein